MPKFQNKEEYEKWKKEKMHKTEERPAEITPDKPPEIFSDVPPEIISDEQPEVRKGSSATLFIWLAMVAVLGLLGFGFYKFFIQEAVLTDTTYTHKSLGFTMDIPIGWEKFKLSSAEKSKMKKVGGGSDYKILFTLSPENAPNTRYLLLHGGLMGIDQKRAKKGIGEMMISMQSAFKREGVYSELLKENIAGQNTTFIRSAKGDELFIAGFILRPQAMVYAQFSSLVGTDYENDFWPSIKSFTLTEE